MLLAYTLREVGKKIRDKEISSQELVSFYCQRIRDVNPAINAIIQFDQEKALQKAEQIDQRISVGDYLGPLHGIPFTAKDWLETKEFISAAGMPTRKEYIPAQNASVIQRLENAGAILIGKTNVPYRCGDTDNPVYGKTRNPYHLEYSPGASSGGEAAIIAAGGTAFGIGSDSGGSIRVPCHFCGIAGLKPTTGRIPNTGHYPAIGGMLDRRSQIGPMARFVDDLCVLFPILAGSDGIDTYVVDMPHVASPSLSTLKIAYYISHGAIYPLPAITTAIEESIHFLRDQVQSIHYDEPASALQGVLDITYRYWELYKNPPTTTGYLQLLREWDELRVKMWKYMEPYDAIITPVCTEPARLSGEIPPEIFPYTLTYSLVGWPCVVVRVSSTHDGMPINLQVIAKPFHEEVCLAIAAQLEKLCGWQEPLI